LGYVSVFFFLNYFLNSFWITFWISFWITFWISFWITCWITCCYWSLPNLILGHDEYLYEFLRKNNSTIPQLGLGVIRFHSFYAWHKAGEYKHLMKNPEDEELLEWVKRYIIKLFKEDIVSSHQIFQKCQNFLLFCVGIIYFLKNLMRTCNSNKDIN
jgi:hypothetical protein